VYPLSIKGAFYEHAGPYDFAVDVWSLGVLLWEVLSGESPFKTRRRKKANFNAMLKQLDYGALRKRGISKDATRLVTQMLALDSTMRPTANQCREHHWFNPVASGRLASTDTSLLQTEIERDETDRLHDDTSKKLMSEIHPQMMR